MRVEVLRPDDADDQIRFSPGERLHHLFESSCDDNGSRTAIVNGKENVTYGELDARANRLARCLLENGVKPGDRVGIYLERSVYTYESLLAVLKAHAVFVPIDTEFPQERKIFIAKDSELSAIITTSDLAEEMQDAPCRRISLDLLREDLAARSQERLEPHELGAVVDDEECYIIYTSGSTGNPKGVSVAHPSI